jgi:hypothetical protein
MHHVDIQSLALVQPGRDVESIVSQYAVNRPARNNLVNGAFELASSVTFVAAGGDDLAGPVGDKGAARVVLCWIVGIARILLDVGSISEGAGSHA